ncbi:MAG: alkaline phosphatase family protein [Nocardioides sp.]
MRITTSRKARRFAVAATAAFTLGLTGLVAPADSAPQRGGSHHAHEQAQRVVFIVLDQLRPEFIKAFDMKNVQALMRGGTSFPNAYLGHMGSETVVSHNVMTSGQLPKHMGWADEWFNDPDGVLGVPGTHYVTGSMAQTQFDALIQDKGYPKLADYLKSEHPGSTVATVGEKNYAVYSMGGPGSDIRLTFSGRSFDCDEDTTVTQNTWRGPTGVGVPTYISDPSGANGSNACKDNPYYVDADSAINYGTLDTSPAWMYPLQGNRDIPGNDPNHQGGDVWVTNAAFDIMDHETDWSGMLLTYGGIDKSGHMWGGLNDQPPYPNADPASHMAAMAKIADDQVGRVIGKLKKDGLLDETLVVLTTDHAQNTADNYFGQDGVNRGNFNWYYGRDADETYEQPQPEIQKLIAGTGDNVAMSMQDSAIRTWLKTSTRQTKAQAADVMKTLGGVRAVYVRAGGHYVKKWEAPRWKWGSRELAWHRKHSQEIVDTQAAAYGPDVIGLLANNTSYGVKGDHGGAQESVQRIPIIFYGAGIKAGKKPGTALRSVDITPTILRELGIRETFPTDGVGYKLP